jgi:prophage regulatory protein
VTTPASTGRRFLSYQDLGARGIRFSRVHLRRLEKAGAFPMHLQLGAGDATQTMKAWVADEVEAWEAERIAERDRKFTATRPIDASGHRPCQAAKANRDQAVTNAQSSGVGHQARHTPANDKASRASGSIKPEKRR